MPNPSPAARRIPPPHDLTIAEPGSTTARNVLSHAIARVLAELPGIGRGLVASPELRTDLQSFHLVCRELTTKHPGALVSLVRRTPIATLLRCSRLRPSEELISELIALIYFELARLEILEAPVRQLRPPKRIVSLAGMLVVDLPLSPKPVTYANNRLIVNETVLRLELYPEVHPGFSRSTVAFTVTRPYYEIENDIVLALVDNNPLAMFEAHPDKQGNSIDLGDKPASDWIKVLRDALHLVQTFLPDLRREMDLFVQQIVPVGYDEHKHLSASYQEAIGTIYMSLHPSLMTMTEALIHEFSHNKINALFELDDVLENAFSPLYTSPVRPDPRPLHGILLAVHAFLPVARLYEKMIEAGHELAQNPTFLARFEKVKQINAEGASVVLEHGRPTPMGKPLLDEIRQWNDHYAKR